MEAKIPLANRLRKESHRQIAAAQDMIVEEVFKEIPGAVFHGGTCIWRGYSGKRFSDDLDFYFPRSIPSINAVFDNLKKRGFDIVKKKIAERSVYSELVLGRVSVRLEGTFQNVKGSLMDYERIDGTVMAVYGLTPEELIREKAATYIKRRKIRDLYDVFFLLRLVKEFNKVKEPIGQLVQKYVSPDDEENLKAIVLEGIVPSSKELIAYITRKWQNPNI
ncbi:nucleotidyl transferase AbiEii/AbiGii toxin family protein [Candidatus Woesearchaeota archaeon]|nr:nucleotidyl transferase AbiEii/AbiGii toxin family protein [Candidatus Woesearchaeota archaeon]